jgi:hypothetical protein
VALTNEGGATTLRHNSIVVKGPPWPAAVSEVMGGRRSGGGYSGGVFCVDRRRRHWSSRRLQCRSRGKQKRGRVCSVDRVRGRGGSGAGDATRRKEEGRRMSYPIFTPKPCTHHMHESGSIVPHIRPKLFTDNQMSRIEYNYCINSVSKTMTTLSGTE